jgi:hypothetical protein
MSDGLLNAARLQKPYLQSPVDDLWSFYYVAQWAAVFNNMNFPDPTLVPADLADLRRLIAGSQDQRSTGLVRMVTGPDLDPTEFGQFLADSSSLLRDWQVKLTRLTTEWNSAKVDRLTDGSLFHSRYPYFRDFTNRGVLELLQLVQEYFLGSLS